MDRKEIREALYRFWREHPDKDTVDFVVAALRDQAAEVAEWKRQYHKTKELQEAWVRRYMDCLEQAKRMVAAKRSQNERSI